MDVTLINAPVRRGSEHSRLAPPLGLAYVASALMREGYRVSAVDFNVSGLNLSRVDGIVEFDQPSIVGISAHTETYPNALAIAQRIKSIDEDITIVFGGPHPTILPLEVLAEECVDYVVIGDGGRTMVELAGHVLEGTGKLDEIEGLGYKAGGLWVNRRRELQDPGDLSYPARSLFPLELYQDKLNVLTSLGSCPFRCPFCSAASIWQGRRKMRAPEDIMDEVTMLIREYGADYVFFTDDIFTLDQQWVYQLTDLLRDLDYPLEWGCATRVDMVDADLLEAMAGSGCRAIQFGVESGSQQILDRVKGISKEAALEAVATAVEAGIEVACSFMIPFPEDTRETLKETKEFMRALRREGSDLLVACTCPYPGTYFYEHAETLGLKIHADGWDDFDAKHVIMETKHLSTEEIEAFVDEVLADMRIPVEVEHHSGRSRTR